MNNNLNWSAIALAAVVTVLAQVGAWFQHNYQFKNPEYGVNWWGWYVLGIPLTYLFIYATKLNVVGYGGSIWAGRFVGFAIGIVVYAAMIQIYFKEVFTLKIAIQILLCLLILAIQAFWKVK